MRLCFVVHGLPPTERGGVEQCTVALCDELARRGHTVEVFAPWSRAELPDRSVRRERRGAWHATFVNVLTAPRGPEEALAPVGMREAFARFLQVERPDVVHVQHLLRLGVELVHEVRETGAPLVFTAHDWYALSDRFALVRPDLARYEHAPTPEEEARADLAQSILNLDPALGDYHLGVPPKWLARDVRERVAETLDGDPVAAGFHADEWRLARERRERMAERRRAAFEVVDVFVSPSRFLADWLAAAFTGSNGGAAPRVVHQPNGIDAARLQKVAPVDTSGGDVRLGFVGSLTKHKGVHLLLEAWALLGDAERARLPLVIFGDSTDRVYVERMRARALELGAVWSGAFESEELPDVLARIDVLVVPSIWYENFPTVLREAFAAGRPAVAADLGALPESVRDDVDGLLFRPDDAADLARVLRRLIEEPGIVERLARGVPSVRTIAEQASDLEELYEGLLADAPSRALPGGDLAHLAELGARYLELGALPTRELLAHCLTRIERLAGVFGLEALRPAELLARGLGEASRTLDELRDRREESGYLERVAKERDKRAQWLSEQLSGASEERDWLRSDRENLARSLSFHEDSTRALEEERTWLLERTESLDRERQWLESKTESLDRERQWLKSTTEDLDRERQWLKSTTEDLGREKEWLSNSLEEAKTSHERERQWRDEMLREIERERDWLRSEMTSREEERAWLRGLVSEKEEALTYVWKLVEGRDSDLAHLREEISACEETAFGLLQAFGEEGTTPLPFATPEEESGGKLERMMSGLVEHGHALLEQLDSLRAAQRRASEELDWRRSEMDLARAALERRTLALVRRFSGLGRVVSRWASEQAGGDA